MFPPYKTSEKYVSHISVYVSIRLDTEVSLQSICWAYRKAMKAIILKIGYDYDFDIQELEILGNHFHIVI